MAPSMSGPFRGQPGELYRPANGTEGDIFTAKFCERCKRNQFELNGETYQCGIYFRTLINDVTDEDYPTQWRYDSDGRPECSAFEAMEGKE